MSAAFSPTMIQAAMVLPDTRLGKMEASATLGGRITVNGGTALGKGSRVKFTGKIKGWVLGSGKVRLIKKHSKGSLLPRLMNELAGATCI